MRYSYAARTLALKEGECNKVPQYRHVHIGLYNSTGTVQYSTEHRGTSTTFQVVLKALFCTLVQWYKVSLHGTLSLVKLSLLCFNQSGRWGSQYHLVFVPWKPVSLSGTG